MTTFLLAMFCLSMLLNIYQFVTLLDVKSKLDRALILAISQRMGTYDSRGSDSEIKSI